MYISETVRVRTASRPVVGRQTEAVSFENHTFEQYLNSPLTRKLLFRLTTPVDGSTALERMFYSYRNADATLRDRIRYAVAHKMIDVFVHKTKISRARATEKVFHHQPTVRTLVNTARSIAVHGLTIPQRFIAPLLVVWNSTNACNLKCRHCYQNATHKRDAAELSRAEKLSLIDQLSELYVPMIAIAGGEPFCDPDIWAVLEHAKRKKVYVTLATNGTLLTLKNVERIAALGVKYVEVSLDSTDASVHDEFRQSPGAWRRSIEGIKNVLSVPGLRCGIATCFTRDTVEQAPAMVELAIALGVQTFVHFNFIPVGRGRHMLREEMTVEQREWLLQFLCRTLDEGKIGIMSTAPQFGRSCIMYGDPDGMMAMGHGGSGRGKQAQVVSKYLGGCGAHRCYCCVQPDGRVNPCVYMPTRTLGNIREIPFARIWNQPLEAVLSDRDDRGDHCGVCDYRAFCGGCRARAEAYTGDVQAGDPGCTYNRHMWDEIFENCSAADVEPMRSVAAR